MKNSEDTYKSIFIISFTILFGFMTDIANVYILTRLYLPAEYALYQFSLSFLSFFTIFANFGLSFMITHYLSAEKDSSKETLRAYISEGFKWIFLLSMMFSILLFILSDLFELLYVMPGLGNVLKFTALTLFAANSINYFESVFQGSWRFGLFALSFIILKMLKFIIVLLCYLLKLQIIHIVGLISIVSLIQLIIIIIFQIKSKNLSQVLKLDRGLTKKIFNYSFYIFLYVLLQYIITNFNQFILAFFVSDAELAFYTMLTWIITNLSILSIILSRFAIPYISHYIKHDNEEAKKKVEIAYNLIIKYGLLSTILINFYFLLFSDYVIILLFGPNYFPISHYLKIYIFYININILDVTGGYFLWASKQTKLVYKLFTITAIFTIILSIILIPFLYIYGAMIAIIIPNSIYVLYSNHLVMKQNKLKFNPNVIRQLIKCIFSAALILIILYFFNLLFQINLNMILMLILISGIFIGSYFILILLLKVIKLSEIKNFIKNIMNSIF